MLPLDVLKHDIKAFLNSPFPLWENNLTRELVALTYERLQSNHIESRLTYGTATALHQNKFDTEKQFLAIYDQKPIYLETPDEDNLQAFYAEHGLIPLPKLELTGQRAATKLKAALNVLAEIPECIACIASLVNCIQIIASDGPDYDTSYSHPAIPFTVFVSVCDDYSPISNIRVAESILHEAMHLKLTLIQRYTELTEPGITELFYSPWRDEERPLNGVLHGIFVFRAIKEFLTLLKNKNFVDSNQKAHLTYRLEDISTDFQTLQRFPKCIGLTKDGANLSANLLPLN